MSKGARLFVQGLSSVVLGVGTLLIGGVELAVESIADHPGAVAIAAGAAGVPWAAPVVSGAAGRLKRQGPEQPPPPPASIL